MSGGEVQTSNEAPLVKCSSLRPVSTAQIRSRYRETSRCVKCVKGIYAGRYFYLTPEQIEVIGTSSSTDPSVTVALDEGCCETHIALQVSEDGVVRVTDQSSEADAAAGTYIRLRHVAPRILEDNHELLFEIFSPDATGELKGAAGSSRSFDRQACRPSGACIVIKRGQPKSEAAAFSDFLDRYEIQGITRNLVMHHVRKGSGEDLFVNFRAFTDSAAFTAHMRALDLEQQMLLHLASIDLTYYLPWKEKSRSLLLYSKNSNELIGEVGWTGAYLQPWFGDHSQAANYADIIPSVLQCSPTLCEGREQPPASQPHLDAEEDETCPKAVEVDSEEDAPDDFQTQALTRGSTTNEDALDVAVQEPPPPPPSVANAAALPPSIFLETASTSLPTYRPQLVQPRQTNMSLLSPRYLQTADNAQHPLLLASTTITYSPPRNARNDSQRAAAHRTLVKQHSDHFQIVGGLSPSSMTESPNSNNADPRSAPSSFAPPSGRAGTKTTQSCGASLQGAAFSVRGKKLAQYFATSQSGVATSSPRSQNSLHSEPVDASKLRSVHSSYIGDTAQCRGNNSRLLSCRPAAALCVGGPTSSSCTSPASTDRSLPMFLTSRILGPDLSPRVSPNTLVYQSASTSPVSEPRNATDSCSNENGGITDRQSNVVSDACKRRPLMKSEQSADWPSSGKTLTVPVMGEQLFYHRTNATRNERRSISIDRSSRDPPTNSTTHQLHRSSVRATSLIRSPASAVVNDLRLVANYQGTAQASPDQPSAGLFKSEASNVSTPTSARKTITVSPAHLLRGASHQVDTLNQAVQLQPLFQPSSRDHGASLPEGFNAAAADNGEEEGDDDYYDVVSQSDKAVDLSPTAERASRPPQRRVSLAQPPSRLVSAEAVLCKRTHSRLQQWHSSVAQGRRLTASCPVGPVEGAAEGAAPARVASESPTSKKSASAAAPLTLSDPALGAVAFWMSAHLSDSDLHIATVHHPTSPPPQQIPDLSKPSLYSCEPLFRNRGLGLPLLLSMLPRKYSFTTNKAPKAASYPTFSVVVGSDETVVEESFAVRLRRAREWLNRHPRQCLINSALPSKRHSIRLPPAYGSGYHLTIRYHQGRYYILDTFPAESYDFTPLPPMARSFSHQRPPAADDHPFIKCPFNVRTNPPIISDSTNEPPLVDTVDAVWLKIRPKVEKHRLHLGDVFRIGRLTFSLQRWNTGIGGLQGYRASMEDEEVVFQDLCLSEEVPVSFYAVYDGHGGRECAAFLHEELHLSFLHQLKIICGNLDESPNVGKSIFTALYRAFVVCDRSFLKLQYKRLQRNNVRNGPGGAAVVVVAAGNVLLCANSGDARAVLCRRGQAIELSVDHKPSRSDEFERIRGAGGYVKNRRVLGRLAVSRAFGDIEYKNVAMAAPSLVIVDPEIRMLEGLSEEDEFLLLACDGLFDVYTSQDVVNQIRERLLMSGVEEQDPQKLIASIVQEAIESRQSRDNVSAILVILNPISSYFH